MLTGSGRAVALLAGLLLVLGWLGDFPEVVALGLAAGVALALAAARVLSRPDLVAVRSVEPTRVGEGEGARSVLTLTNDGSRRSLPALAVEHVGQRQVAVPLPALPAGAQHRVAYPLPTQRRGVYPVGPLTMGVSDPFRLLHTSRDFASHSTLTVHPTVHRVRSVPTGRSRDQDGATASSAVRGGVAFHSLRPYERGDDPRHIHWRSSARIGEPVVRENVVPNEPELLVLLDTSTGAYDDDAAFEDAVRIVASLAVAGWEAGFPLTLATTAGEQVLAVRGPTGRLAVLDTLAAVQRSDDPGLQVLLRGRRRRQGVSLGVVTGERDEAALACLATVRPRFEMVTLVQVGTPGGGQWRPLRGVFRLQASNSTEFAAVWNSTVRR